jgi:hypothetical protein
LHGKTTQTTTRIKTKLDEIQGSPSEGEEEKVKKKVKKKVAKKKVR